MRFSYVLLGLVTLAKLGISSGSTCSNGISGVQGGDTCCLERCSVCSLSPCFIIPDYGCCTGVINQKCSVAGKAPCVIDVAPTCSNGVTGVQFNDSICCEAQCGTCGGSGCDTRPGGRHACCAGTIPDDRNMCSDTKKAPCIIH